MDPPIQENAIAGIHHITAVASSAAQNLRFYTRVLGLKLVKKTVNFDDPFTYHLYYGDEAGHPGTILTFESPRCHRQADCRCNGDGFGRAGKRPLSLCHAGPGSTRSPARRGRGPGGGQGEARWRHRPPHRL